MLITGSILAYLGVGAALTYQAVQVRRKHDGQNRFWQIMLHPWETLVHDSDHYQWAFDEPGVPQWQRNAYYVASSLLWPVRVAWFIAAGLMLLVLGFCLVLEYFLHN